MPRSGKEQRQQAILMQLIREGWVSTQALSAEFGITDVAIRGDFDELGNLFRMRGLHLHRVYGGAELVEMAQLFRGFYEGARETEIEALQTLGEYVAERLVSDWDQLLLDAGRTIDRIAQCLAGRSLEGIRIITNSYAPHILELYTKGGVELAQLGGKPVSRAFCYVDCPGGDDFYRPYWAGSFTAILTGSGFRHDTGLLVNNPHIIQMKQRFIKAASRVILVLDHTKFSKTARGTVTFCGFRPDPWLIQHHSARREAGSTQTQRSLPLTIVTDIPTGQKATDLELARYLTPQADGKVCIFETQIPLVL